MSVSRRRAGGFTLIELLAVMVILGALAAGFGGFVSAAAQGYAAVAERSAAAQQAALFSGVFRSEMESAVPGSARWGASGRLEFAPVIASGAVRFGSSGETSECAATGSAPGEALDREGEDGCFETLGWFAAPQASGLWLALAPKPGDAGFYGPRGRARITGLSSLGEGARVEFEPTALSGGEDGLFYMSSGPVSYACDAGKGELRRYWGYEPSAEPGAAIESLRGVKSAAALSGLSSCALDLAEGPDGVAVAMVSVSLKAAGSSVAMRFQARASSRLALSGERP